RGQQGLPGGPGRQGRLQARARAGGRAVPLGGGAGVFREVRPPLRGRGENQMTAPDGRGTVPPRRRGGGGWAGWVLAEVAALLLLGGAPLQARTVVLTDEDCTHMAAIAAEAPRL